MKKILFLLLAVSIMASCTKQDENIITRSNIKLESDVMTPEALWAMGRIGSYSVSPDGSKVAYQVSYYSVEENRSNAVLYCQTIGDSVANMLGLGSDPVWLSDDRLAFASKGEVWTMNANGKGRKQLTKTDGEVEGFLFDLPKATGRLVTDLMYRHWDHYVESIPHPFIYSVGDGFAIAEEGKDILEGMPFECPMEPFGGIEQLAWSTDSRKIAYTCRTKTGLEMSISTDSDIFLFDLDAEEGTIDRNMNLCKEGVDLPESDPTKTLKDQPINHMEEDLQVGYDQNPKFSPGM